MIVYVARWLVPVASPPVSGGAVAVRDGRIVASGRRREVIKAAPQDAEVRDLGEVALLPGLVNAHTHLDLSWIAADPPRVDSYVDWIRDLVAKREAAGVRAAISAAEEAAEKMAAGGTAAVGDVGNAPWSASVLARSVLRGISFHEIYGFRSADAERLLESAAARLDEIEADTDVRSAVGRVAVALTPHGAHTTSASLLKALAGRSMASREPLTIHVAESEEEVAFLRDGSGPFPQLLRDRGAWDESWKPLGHSPVEHLDRIGALTSQTLAVHCIHVDHQDISRLQARGVTVVTCPRSNVTLGVGRAPVPKLLNSGIPVALGTDSLASTPDLDLFAEMAALRREHPSLSPAAVLRMATLNGARALRISDDLGTIEPGKVAALAVVPLTSPEDDPLELVTSGPAGAMLADRAPWEAGAT